MKEQLKNNKQLKDLLMKFIYAAVIAAVAMLFLNVMTQNKDGRKQVVDNDGGTEYVQTAVSSASLEEVRLQEILSLIKGVGDVDVMVTYHDNGQVSSVFSNTDDTKTTNVKGVIVTAEGAGSPAIKSDIINAVSSVFDIPGSSVMVFERK